ncbi:hypothetical protein PV371_38860 [Streptomyces sp. TX20-6-3]|uniref:DUF7455 domain-containing protein n=1 Tax=Streptomyces sp. TX20-6-3 TaxID=3028705 RepID=UPI0029ADC242|nr:hypothetical protein [Streptomyces sp. TX20-6-3]MDX2565467.1 hypothetical protein [Streptomyces sp. TX20-6-3]
MTHSLTAEDRCDRCGSQAYIRAQFSQSHELLFCAHHGRRYKAALELRVSELLDETHRLTVTNQSR